ncbi:FIST N-terminal domain-containing protein [Methylococcus geothermalis]|uniref:FIST domain containing protein n=1 Tax=Methylococcus geothermalis TaxID=2681310 RepID=A0A858Q9P7_9GAMM|nr:FIST N-terminal domain-containing protein [Methylococcus geothermalis]QJD30587.1 FIST domain containing protein [Methylococcus geothermalis]
MKNRNSRSATGGKNSSSIRIAQSCAADPREAVREFHAGVKSQQPALVTFFCSSEYDLDAIAAEMRRLFAGLQVVGCTTAGEIGPAGYREHSLAGASFQADSFHAVADILTGLQQFVAARAYALAQALLQRLEVSAPGARPENSFALLMIDGLSVREEEVAHVLQDALGKLPLIGGSAGDGMKFAKTQVYFDGHFHTDTAVLTLFSTPLPFKAFMTEHFAVTDERMMVTEADTAHRIVREINGRPALQEYARLIGIDPAQVGSEHFAASPVVVRIGGTDYVRSIQKANADGSLTFYCAIETGMVLRLGRSGDLERNVAQTFEQLRETLGPLQGVIACDCIFRNLEMTRCGVKQQVGRIFQNNHAVGFSTYGEQYLGVHINQTFTGIAIGAPGRPRHDGQ